MFEKAVYHQLYDFFSINNLFYNSQHGFKQLHSTETAALEFIDRTYQLLESGKIPISVYLDLSKAFDTLDHGTLLHKLEYYGIRGTALNWFKSYLNNRHQFVEYDGVQSDSLPICTGVPQGSILGPLLFIIYINDIHLASSKFTAILYADDTTLINSLCSFHYDSDSTTENLSANINFELNKVQSWLVANKLSLNVSKTRYMIFHFPQRKLNLNINLSIDNILIERTTQFDFLGLMIHENLNWNAHINKISNKLSRIIGTLKRLHNYLPTQGLLLIYNSLFLPHLNYSILAWGHSCDRVIKLQKKAIRLVSSSSYFAHTEPIFKQLKLLKVQDLLQLKALKFYYRYNQNQLPRYFDNMFTPLPVTHMHDTRHRDLPRYPLPKRASTKNCIRYYIPVILKEMPQNIKEKISTHSYYGFSNYSKIFFISKYSETCTIVNCFVCSNI